MAFLQVILKAEQEALQLAAATSICGDGNPF